MSNTLKEMKEMSGNQEKPMVLKSGLGLSIFFTSNLIFCELKTYVKYQNPRSKGRKVTG